MSERFGEYMLSAGGLRVYPLDPRPDEIHLDDIAHALSNICRFGGHCREFYSVAQHSVHVSELLRGVPALVGLLHDAAEAYLGDIIRPLKGELFTARPTRRYPDEPPRVEYRCVAVAEHRMLKVIYGALGVPSVELGALGLVRDADLVMLATERRDLMPDTDGEWECLRGINRRPAAIEPWTPARARTRFLERYAELRKTC
jgi:hypothetical protein